MDCGTPPLLGPSSVWEDTDTPPATPTTTNRQLEVDRCCQEALGIIAAYRSPDKSPEKKLELAKQQDDDPGFIKAVGTGKAALPAIQEEFLSQEDEDLEILKGLYRRLRGQEAAIRTKRVSIRGLVTNHRLPDDIKRQKLRQIQQDLGAMHREVKRIYLDIEEMETAIYGKPVKKIDFTFTPSENPRGTILWYEIADAVVDVASWTKKAAVGTAKAVWKLKRKMSCGGRSSRRKGDVLGDDEEVLDVEAKRPCLGDNDDHHKVAVAKKDFFGLLKKKQNTTSSNNVVLEERASVGLMVVRPGSGGIVC